MGRHVEKMEKDYSIQKIKEFHPRLTELIILSILGGNISEFLKQDPPERITVKADYTSVRVPTYESEEDPRESYIIQEFDTTDEMVLDLKELDNSKYSRLSVRTYMNLFKFVSERSFKDDIVRYILNDELYYILDGMSKISYQRQRLAEVINEDLKVSLSFRDELLPLSKMDLYPV